MAAILWAPVTPASAADTNAPAASASKQLTKSTAAKPDPKPAKKADPKKAKPLSGAELYAINCNRCHPERDPSEYTASQWQTLMIYMRVRANLPADQARAITEYLKDQAGQ